MPQKKRNAKTRKNGFRKKYQNQRMKRVEVKRREHADISIRNSTGSEGTTFSPTYPDTTKLTPISSATAMSLMPLRSFYRVSKGSRPNQMVGNEIFSKSLYLKGKISGLPANNSVEAYVYWGWVQDKLGYTDFTTPSRANATSADLESFVLEQVKQHFDEKADEMRYREKKLDNIKIAGVRKLQHPQDASYQDSVDFKCSWRTNRKIPYTQCARVGEGMPTAGNNFLQVMSNDSTSINLTDSAKDENDVGGGGDVGQFLPLNSWLPFALVYVPEFATVSPHTVNLQYNDIHYFTG